jgi:hypothetical protein
VCVSRDRCANGLHHIRVTQVELVEQAIVFRVDVRQKFAEHVGAAQRGDNRTLVVAIVHKRFCHDLDLVVELVFSGNSVDVSDHNSAET